MHTVAGGGPEAPPEPDLEAVRLVQWCLAGLAARSEQFVALLGEQIADLVSGPQPADPPAAEPAEFGRRLAHLVLQAAIGADSPSRLGVQLQHAGADGVQVGFCAEHYGSIGQALLRTARQVHEGEWSNALSSAWVEVFVWIRGHLLLGAAARQSVDADPSDQPDRRRAQRGRRVAMDRPLDQQDRRPPPTVPIRVPPQG